MPSQKLIWKGTRENWSMNCRYRKVNCDLPIFFHDIRLWLSQQKWFRKYVNNNFVWLQMAEVLKERRLEQHKSWFLSYLKVCIGHVGLTWPCHNHQRPRFPHPFYCSTVCNLCSKMVIGMADHMFTRKTTERGERMKDAPFPFKSTVL